MKSKKIPGIGWRTLAALAAVAALFFLRMREHVDPDLFFHLKEGGRVLTEWRLPLNEDYSFTRAGKPMVATEWLSGAIFALFFAVAGYPLVALLNAALLVATLWLLSSVWEEDGPPEAVRVALIALAAFGFLSFALAKVQNFTFLFFAAYLFAVRRWEKGARWAPWAMAAGLAVWVNLHGGFTLGWVLLGGICGLDFLKSRRPRDLAPWAAGTFACFLHPNGATAFVYPIWFVFAAPPGRSMILEWTRLPFAPSAAPYALLLAVAVWARVDRVRSRFPWAAMAVVFLVMTLRSRKMAPFFVLSASAACGLAFGRAAWSRARAFGAAAFAAASLAAIAAVEAGEARALAAFGPASDWQREYPREAAARFAALHPGRRLFHSYEWGGYLLWALPPGDKVFIDGRLDPYWTLLDDYHALNAAAPGWEKLLDAYGIEAALLPPSAGLAKALDRDARWKKEGTDGRAVLYARRSGNGIITP